ncbi:MAG: cupin [Deltaproteobacteria bacterium RIFOXYA12_FULL_58_15]|nr:MAG: cupin [Deltaproteobacteria bacterium RIFOXYA12_FULL_58_15]OGR10098.1 MAG: cupin [Deltaproteobacteria bacterium RIFOXYB12_FULL_58_9]
MGESKPGAIDPATAVQLEQLVNYGAGAVVSRTLAKGPAGTLTVFAFDEGQELSEHSAPFDAYVTIVDGTAMLIIGGKEVVAEKGETVLMPADIPHAVRATQPFKMLLIMLKNPR